MSRVDDPQGTYGMEYTLNQGSGANVIHQLFI
jgi:hypothetical protein